MDFQGADNYRLSNAAAASICSCPKAGANTFRSAEHIPTRGLSAICCQFATAACTLARTDSACCVSSETYASPSPGLFQYAEDLTGRTSASPVPQ